MHCVQQISDFGLAREVKSGTTEKTETTGTITHVPPELLHEGKVSKSADVYAFGIIMWELWTGQRPYSGCTSVQVIAQRLMGRSGLTFPSNAPRDYVALAKCCMADNQLDRPTFAEVLAEVQRMVAEAEAAPGHQEQQG